MRPLLLLILGLCLSLSPAAFASQQADIVKSPSCRHCGMDRHMFNHSRMLIEYEDGSTVATCSLHCTAVELATTIDRTPILVRVADYDSKELLEVDKAVWVVGGSKQGVMTGKAKWAFSSGDAAGKFIKMNGGTIAGFDEAIKAAYDDMYQDTKMIREFRELKRKILDENLPH